MNTGFEGKRILNDTSIFEQVQLENGVTLWIQKLKHAFDRKGVVLACLPLVGAGCDLEDAPGTAHFFEHIPFSGTVNKPSYEKIWGPIEDLNGKLNASTSPLVIEYSCVLPENEIDLAMETVFELVAMPLFREEDVVKEREVILAEYRRYCANPEKVTTEFVRKEFWQHKLPFATNIIGTPPSIKAMTAERLKEFFLKYFSPKNFHILIGGAFAFRSDVVAIAKKYFGQIPRQTVPSSTISRLLPPPSKERKTITNPGFGRDAVYMIWMLGKDSRYPLKLLANHVAVGMTSPLVAELRHSLGVLYEAHLGNAVALLDKTLFEIWAPIEAKHLSRFEAIVREAIAKVSPEDFVREQRIRQISRDYAAPHPVGSVHNAVSDLLEHGRIRSCYEDEEDEDALTVEAAMQVRDAVLNQQPFVCTALR